jgi:hypothetical protein
MKKLDVIIKALLGMGITMFMLYCGLAGVLIAQIF